MQCVLLPDSKEKSSDISDVKNDGEIVENIIYK